MPNQLGAFEGVAGRDEWGVAVARQGEQFRSPVDLLGRSVERFAGELLSGEAGRMRDALVYQQVAGEDESGRVSLGRDGSLSLKPKGQAWSLDVGPESIRVGFDTRQTRQQPQGLSELLEQQGPADPLAQRSPAKQELERMLTDYQASNPDWYRP